METTSKVKHVRSESLRKVFLNDGKWFPSIGSMQAALGRDTADVLMKHLDFQIYYGVWYSENIRCRIKFEMGIGHRKQKVLEDRLIEFGFLSVKKVGQQNKNAYMVHINAVTRFHEKLLNGGKNYIHECRRNDYSPVKLHVNGTSGPANSAGDEKGSGAANFAVPKDIQNNKKDSKESYENSEKILTEQIITPPRKSRLNRDGKDDDVVVPEIETSSVRNITDKVGGLAPITVPQKALACIEHWNSYPELARLKVNPDSPTHSLKYTIRAIADFFSGEFLLRTIVPKTFRDDSWFDTIPTVDDFKELVDEFVYCIREPELKPVYNNGFKPSILDFIRGNSFVKGTDPMPSLMLLYCFGSYKTVIDEKYPIVTVKVKEIWKKYLGDYTDSPGVEKAFIQVANMCFDHMKEKRKDNPDWIPAMNDYRAEGIVRQIIIKQAEYLKREKKTPEFMGTNYFLNMVRRYDYDKKTGIITF